MKHFQKDHKISTYQIQIFWDILKLNVGPFNYMQRVIFEELLMDQVNFFLSFQVSFWIHSTEICQLWLLCDQIKVTCVSNKSYKELESGCLWIK